MWLHVFLRKQGHGKARRQQDAAEGNRIILPYVSRDVLDLHQSNYFALRIFTPGCKL